MIGIAFMISFVALVVAIRKKSRFMKVVILLAVLSVITFFVTVHFTNRHDAQNPFAGIGYAIIGSITVTVLSLTALILSFKQKQIY